jgi:succinate-semialdehyde dehydrogenase/glutarate-semialdehyde dehydrogenase
MTKEASKISIVNPATLEPYAEIECTPLDQISSMVGGARSAQQVWISTPLRERIDALERLQELVCAKSEEIAQVVSNETGKPRIDAINTDVLAGLASLDYSVSAMRHLFEERRVDFGSLDRSMRLIGRRSYLRSRPLGVVAVVSPWNYPFCISFSQSAMAVAAGNAVIIKPSSATPFSSMKVAQLFEEAGVTRGLVQAVIGPGKGSTEALLSAGVDKLIFTGSSETGREVMAECSRTLTPVVLELGGKDPMIVLADADLQRAADGGTWGAFVNAGQTCAGVKRIIVQEEVYAPFVRELKLRAEALKLGWGWDDPDISVGPLISEAAVQEMERLVSGFLAGGAELVCGGKRPEGLKGHFFQPTILSGVGQQDAATGKEIFGPVITVSKAQSEEDAVRLANSCRYALCASVWTRDSERGRKVAQRLIGGTAVVNNTPYTYGLTATPWGGSRESGFGRTHGALGFDELLEWHHVHVDQGRTRRDIWWHPYSQERLDVSRGYLRITFSREHKGRLDALRRIRNLMNRKQL